VEKESNVQEGLLRELLAWTRFANRGAFVSTLRNVLAEPRHLLAYELSDGKSGQTSIAKACGLSQPTVSGLWSKWRRLGLVMDEEGRARHLIRPSDLGIEIPKVGARGPAEAKQARGPRAEEQSDESA
jgi:hypothetical protein